MNGNKVCGIDQNPHLCQLPIKVYKGDAARLNEAVGEKNFDVVMSMWMTEYLNHEQLQAFLCQSRQMLSGGGMLLTTIIADKGMGILYVTAAKKLRHIAKYCYNISVVEKMTRQAGFNSVEIKTLNARLGLSWAYLVSAQI
jgi:cyclopropane fatty-acyl-phospholipid synthase-like methyltransferase